MRKGSAMLVLLILLLLASLAFLGYLMYINVPGKPLPLISNKTFTEQQNNIDTTNFSQSKQFYPRMRFTDRVISYGIDPACSAEKKSQMLKAFTIVSTGTPLTFYPADNPQILISCSEVAPPSDSTGHFVAGEGGPYEILNASSYAIILSSHISLYRDESCITPHIAVHELLHALGFDHNDNPNSILYPTLDCKQTLDTYFTTQLNELYREDSLPDLVITSLNGTKAGRYLSFSISVSNRGLKDAATSQLTVVTDTNEIIKEFDLGEIELGTTKILTVSNLAGSRSAEHYRFIVDQNNAINELHEDNNDATLSLN